MAQSITVAIAKQPLQNNFTGAQINTPKITCSHRTEKPPK
jgi:hypothetical protein